MLRRIISIVQRGNSASLPGHSGEWNAGKRWGPSWAVSFFIRTVQCTSVGWQLKIGRDLLEGGSEQSRNVVERFRAFYHAGFLSWWKTFGM